MAKIEDNASTEAEDTLLTMIDAFGWWVTGPEAEACNEAWLRGDFEEARRRAQAWLKGDS